MAATKRNARKLSRKISVRICHFFVIFPVHFPCGKFFCSIFSIFFCHFSDFVLVIFWSFFWVFFSRTNKHLPLWLEFLFVKSSQIIRYVGETIELHRIFKSKKKEKVCLGDLRHVKLSRHLVGRLPAHVECRRSLGRLPGAQAVGNHLLPVHHGRNPQPERRVGPDTVRYLVQHVDVVGTGREEVLDDFQGGNGSCRWAAVQREIRQSVYKK